MSEILDNIVNCNISIEKPLEDESSFGTVMLVGDGPGDGGNNLKAVDRYASLAEILDAGWKESDSIYKAARIAFLQDPRPDQIYISVRQMAETSETEVNSGDGADETGGTSKAKSGTKAKQSPDTLERFSETVKRIIDKAGWYGLALVGAEDTDLDEVAQLIESTEKIFAFYTQLKKNPLSRNDYLRTFGIYTENAEEYAHVAWLVKGFSYEPGSETWAFKQLSGVTVSDLTMREMRDLESENLNYYVPCASKQITRMGKMIGGEWIDVIRFRDWLKNQMQIRIFELFIKNPKIPYLDSGIVLVENQMRAVLQAGQAAGGIADTEYDEDDEPVEGYTVTVPKAASLSAAQRARRTLPGCKFTARLAGAIHAVELRGNLVY